MSSPFLYRHIRQNPHPACFEIACLKRDCGYPPLRRRARPKKTTPHQSPPSHHHPAEHITTTTPATPAHQHNPNTPATNPSGHQSRPPKKLDKKIRAESDDTQQPRRQPPFFTILPNRAGILPIKTRPQSPKKPPFLTNSTYFTNIYLPYTEKKI
jgi:hypothetical protein